MSGFRGLELCASQMLTQTLSSDCGRDADHMGNITSQHWVPQFVIFPRVYPFSQSVRPSNYPNTLAQDHVTLHLVSKWMNN